MGILARFEEYYYEAKHNKWFRYFTVFCRVALALGFIPSGIVKIMGERFTGLPDNHPLGHYLEALHHTGFYYPLIGVAQVTAALLLLIPRTALLGALMYLPVMLNICLLAYATRFEGTRITTLMVLANLYLLCWDYDRLKSILPIKRIATSSGTTIKQPMSNRFPFAFFGTVVGIAALVIAINQFVYAIRPGNSMIECQNGCPGNDDPKACETFCNCIYNQGKSLDSCLAEYKKARKQHGK